MQGFDKIPLVVMEEMKIKDGCQRPYLSTDRNHIRADTAGPPLEHFRQAKKKKNDEKKKK